MSDYVRGKRIARTRRAAETSARAVIVAEYRAARAAESGARLALELARRKLAEARVAGAWLGDIRERWRRALDAWRAAHARTIAARGPWRLARRVLSDDEARARQRDAYTAAARARLSPPVIPPAPSEPTPSEPALQRIVFARPRGPGHKKS